MRARDVTGLTGRYDDPTSWTPATSYVELVLGAVLRRHPRAGVRGSSPHDHHLDRGGAVGHGRLREQQVTARLRLVAGRGSPRRRPPARPVGRDRTRGRGAGGRPGRRRPAAHRDLGLRGLRRLPQRPRGSRDRPGEPARRPPASPGHPRCRRSGRAAHGRRRRRRHGVGGRHPGRRFPGPGGRRARRRHGVLPAAVPALAAGRRRAAGPAGAVRGPALRDGGARRPRTSSCRPRPAGRSLHRVRGPDRAQGLPRRRGGPSLRQADLPGAPRPAYDVRAERGPAGSSVPPSWSSRRPVPRGGTPCARRSWRRRPSSWW